MAACCTFNSNGGTLPAERERHTDRQREREAERKEEWVFAHNHAWPRNPTLKCLSLPDRVHMCKQSCTKKVMRYDIN